MKRYFCVIMVFFIVMYNLNACANRNTNATQIESALQSGNATVAATEVSYDLLQMDANIDSFQLQIQDQLYMFPMRYNEFISNGWRIDDRYEDLSGEIGSNQDELVWFANDNYRIICYLFNPDHSEQKYENCFVAGIKVNIQTDAEGLEIFLPGGLKLGESKKDQFVAAYGEADHAYESPTSSSLTWETENVWANVKVTFNPDGVAIAYDGRNPTAPTDYVYSDPVVIEQDYQVPSALSLDIEDRIVLFAGDLYSLPAPLSAFIENGWDTTDADTTVSGNGILSLNLKRNCDEFRVTVHNYSDSGCVASAAYIEKLSSVDCHGELFAVADKLNTDILEDELLDYLKENDLSFEQTVGTFGNTYNVTLKGKAWSNYCVFNCDENGVRHISICSGKS